MNRGVRWAWVAVLVWLGGCATGLSSAAVEEPPGHVSACGGAAVPTGWPDLSSNTEALLAPFFTCLTPGEFVQLQRGVDMARLVERLDDWSAVRLGALGPITASAADALNHKRASFLSACVREYGAALGEVFALFVLQSSSDQEVTQVLGALARDRRLSQTLGGMVVVGEQLRRRGLSLADFPERLVRPREEVTRGVSEGLGDMVSAIPLFQAGASAVYDERKWQLPAPYREALTQVEQALVTRAYSSGHVALGVLDEMTFGVPLGCYYLAVSTGRGVSSLAEGEYERAAHALTPAALLVTLYIGGKVTSELGAASGGLVVEPGGTPLQALTSRLEELRQTAQRLREQVGEGGVEALARYLQADPEAALLLAEGGEAGAVALGRARGDVPRARAWLSQAGEQDPRRTPAVGGTTGVSAQVAALADEVALPQEVLDSRLLEAEHDTSGPRLSRNVAVLRKQLAALREAPPAGAPSQPLWAEYVHYGEERLAHLERGTKEVEGRPVEPPLQWDGYQRMRGLVTRGLRFEREMVTLLREDAALPRAQRRFLGEFVEPRVEAYVGVWKPRTELRFADALVIEEGGTGAGPPRVETFSFKSRDLSRLNTSALKAQVMTDARMAWACYGESLDIRRPALKSFVQPRSKIPVPRVRLIYEGGALKPTQLGSKELKGVVDETRSETPGVEVLFQ